MNRDPSVGTGSDTGLFWELQAIWSAYHVLARGRSGTCTWRAGKGRKKGIWVGRGAVFCGQVKLDVPVRQQSGSVW